jgi:hypothetical protein
MRDWLAFASIAGRAERARGIENTAVDPILYRSQCIAIFAERCVRSLCEKWSHTSQRQPARPREKASAVRQKHGKGTFLGRMKVV